VGSTAYLFCWQPRAIAMGIGKNVRVWPVLLRCELGLAKPSAACIQSNDFDQQGDIRYSFVAHAEHTSTGRSPLDLGQLNIPSL